MYRLRLLSICVSLQLLLGCSGGVDPVTLVLVSGVGGGNSDNGNFIGTRYVASSVLGRILEDGEPLTDVKVIRRIHVLEWGSSTSQEATTDPFGYFRWDHLKTTDLKRGITKMHFQHEYLVEQDGQMKLIWMGTKYGADNLNELFSAGDSVMPAGKEFFHLSGDGLAFTIDLADL